ncbi:hypothetical protein LEMLEM_LOCUS1755, partial [Lemmus lemmus]
EVLPPPAPPEEERGGAGAAPAARSPAHRGAPPTRILAPQTGYREVAGRPEPAGVPPPTRVTGGGEGVRCGATQSGGSNPGQMRS